VITWSYSNWSMFDECPKQFKAIVLDKEFERRSSPALARGDEIHRGIAEMLRGTGLHWPSVVSPKARKMIDKLIARMGKPLVEQKLAVDADMNPVPYFDKAAALRGNVDAIWIDRESRDIYVFDWKTGKSQADSTQLELMCALVAAHVKDPIERYHAMFYYLENESNNYAIPVRSPDELRKFFKRFYTTANSLLEASTFEPKPGFHCRWCPVTTCPHNPSTVPSI